MTTRKVYIDLLTELRKNKAPHLHLDQFLYFINKGIQEYINVAYERYNTTQQWSDAMSALTVPGVLTITGTSFSMTVANGDVGSGTLILGKKFGYDYVNFPLPEVYWHLTGVHVSTATRRAYKCHPPGYIHSDSAKRLTTDKIAGISNNAFLKPDLERPYYFMQDGFNQSQADLLVFYGNPSTVFPSQIEFDFLKKPQELTLTVEERDAVEDTSATVEFPNYVVNEIIKKVVLLILENNGNPRMQSMPPVNQSITM
jgi:hypothetical protein